MESTPTELRPPSLGRLAELQKVNQKLTQERNELRSMYRAKLIELARGYNRIVLMQSASQHVRLVSAELEIIGLPISGLDLSRLLTKLASVESDDELCSKGLLDLWVPLLWQIVLVPPLIGSSRLEACANPKTGRLLILGPPDRVEKHVNWLVSRAEHFLQTADGES